VLVEFDAATSALAHRVAQALELARNIQQTPGLRALTA
jgi:hypothetical protein